MIKKILPTYLVYLFILSLIDFAWLYFSGPIFYKKNIGYLMGDKFLLTPAIIFYLLYALGITIFILHPTIIKQESNIIILFKGFLFGLCAYGAYNLTNQATIKDWPLIVTIIDMSWGCFVTGFSSLITVLLLKKLY